MIAIMMPGAQASAGNCLSPSEHEAYWRGYDPRLDSRGGFRVQIQQAEQAAEATCRAEREAQRAKAQAEALARQQQQLAQAVAAQADAQEASARAEEQRRLQEARQAPTYTPTYVEADEPLSTSQIVLLWLGLGYVLVSGLVMWPFIRPWFNGTFIFVWGRSFVENFFKLIFYRLMFEVLVFAVACVLGALGGWIYAFSKIRSPRTLPRTPPSSPWGGGSIGSISGASSGLGSGTGSVGSTSNNIIPFARRAKL
jgi:hypothetical protein